MGVRRRLVLASAVIAGVVIACAIMLDGLDPARPGAEPPGSAPAGVATSGAAPTTSSSYAPSAAGASPRATAADVLPGTPAAIGSVADPADPLEVSAPTPAATGLPASAPRAALVARPFPADASADGALVAGFPEVIPVLPGSVLGSSSITTGGTVLRAGLTATIDASPAEISAGYRDALGARGFVFVDVPTAGDGASTLFSSGSDSIALTIEPTGTARLSYSVFAVLHAEG
ncbi:hypothetical protein HQQ80_02800 [Microbacteriaceae bacterium VKM Ac-2855]|nr:hypothetical protein [Microbacteriaceae bacterium VKM Ac-2855]